LFWKKMTKTTDTCEIDGKEIIADDDKREAFRYIFKKDHCLSMDFKQQAVKVLNISAGGLAFKGDGFTQYDVDQITLFLDIPNWRGVNKFSAQLRILNISTNGICHCIFENCTIEKYEIIHKYVLEMQKSEIQRTSKNWMTKNHMK